MNFIADWISVYLILYTWDDPMIEAPQTFSVFSSATLPKIMMGTRLNAGFLIFITILILVCILYARHLFFFKVRVVGGSPRAAQYAGINSKKVILMSMVIGAGLAGLGGGLHLIGVERIMRMEMIEGYGFLAIAAALLGALHPLGVFFASLFICSVWNGSLYTVLLVGVRLHSAFIFSGLIVICVLLIHFAERRLLRWFGRYYSVRQQ
jgi:simple sugar transport system permease protein